MDFYVLATFLGSDGTYGYTHEEEYELSVNVSEAGEVKIYECPNGQDWIFPNLYQFLKSWSNVSLKA